jgi:hypothetical protein
MTKIELSETDAAIVVSEDGELAAYIPAPREDADEDTEAPMSVSVATMALLFLSGSQEGAPEELAAAFEMVSDYYESLLDVADAVDAEPVDDEKEAA